MVKHQIAHELSSEFSSEWREEVDFHLIVVYLFRSSKQIEMGEEVMLER